MFYVVLYETHEGPRLLRRDTKKMLSAVFLHVNIFAACTKKPLARLFNRGKNRNFVTGFPHTLQHQPA
jgi:hypothetical protein